MGVGTMKRRFHRHRRGAEKWNRMEEARLPQGDLEGGEVLMKHLSSA